MRVKDIFASIQGEGKHIGKPTTFVRLSGCNLRCRWCDTRYAWTGGKEISVDEIVEHIRRMNLPNVCITGGEPMLQEKELEKLVGKLKRGGYHITLETNGTLYNKKIFDNVDCASVDMKPPSSGEKSDERILKKLKEKDQVKVIIANDRDLRFAKRITGKSKVETILQPAAGANIKRIANKVIRQKINARLLPQLHKIIKLK